MHGVHAPTVPSTSVNADKQKLPVPHDLVPYTPHKRLIFHARYQLGGVCFSRRSTHVGNSLVMFYPSGSSTLTPGSIKHIFEDNGQILFAIQRQLPADSNVVDPFQPYPYFPARLYSKELNTDLEILNPGAIGSHFVRWCFSKNHVVVLTLMKASHHLLNLPCQPSTPALRTKYRMVNVCRLASCQLHANPVVFYFHISIVNICLVFLVDSKARNSVARHDYSIYTHSVRPSVWRQGEALNIH